MFQFNKNLPVQAKFALNLNNCQGYSVPGPFKLGFVTFGLSESVLFFRILCQQIKKIFFHLGHQ
jgi:hypothetical protein